LNAARPAAQTLLAAFVEPRLNLAIEAADGFNMEPPRLSVAPKRKNPATCLSTGRQVGEQNCPDINHHQLIAIASQAHVWEDEGGGVYLLELTLPKLTWMLRT
jgi:hypothetical protein